jgi:hypothetical protein
MSKAKGKAGTAARFEEITSAIDKLTVQFFYDNASGRLLDEVADREPMKEPAPLPDDTADETPEAETAPAEAAETPDPDWSEDEAPESEDDGATTF